MADAKESLANVEKAAHFALQERGFGMNRQHPTQTEAIHRTIETYCASGAVRNPPPVAELAVLAYCQLSKKDPPRSLRWNWNLQPDVQRKIAALAPA